ncbi:MAG TPA: rhomboid family intramembrane serine protease [Candidatus Acidoferrales bacterium]|nr:rhomboid family intramembrane serine protease [Candidatus Acidoferrales bacterium]
MSLSPRLRWKLDQIRRKTSRAFLQKEPPRPKLCPSCGTLVGAHATHCHQCGANVNFSLAAASKSLGRLMPSTSPATYAILGVSCVLYVVCSLATIREGGLVTPGGGVLAVFGLGGIRGDVLFRLGASLPLPYNLVQPWRFVTAIFLHASLLHIVFNMWVLMDIGPDIEDLYGSARFFFIYVITGIGGYIVSSAVIGHTSVGASGALLGLIGVLLAATMGRRGLDAQILRRQLIRWLIYVAVWGFLFPGVDNYAHAGGFVTGFILGKTMQQRPPATPEGRKWAYALGWLTALVVVASFVWMALWLRRLS